VVLSRVVPAPVRRRLRSLQARAQRPGLVLGDWRRYRQAAAAEMVPRNPGNARALMAFFSHSLQKGLSRQGDEFRPGFGVAALTALSSAMQAWLRLGGGQDDTFFVEAASTVNAYLARHQALGVATGDKEGLFPPDLLATIRSIDSDLGGVKTVAAPPSSEPRDFAQLAAGRVSIRHFGPGQVDRDRLTQAVDIARHTPSVCNRQPVRVHAYQDAALIETALRLQGGLTGFASPPTLLAVTADLTAFVAATERNEPYVDGGLFAMSLLYALEHLGLAACPLNAMFNHHQDKALRQLLDIPKTECFVMFIAVGPRPDPVVVPKSARQPVDGVLRIHGA
jgi:nitroreductase